MIGDLILFFMFAFFPLLAVVLLVRQTRGARRAQREVAELLGLPIVKRFGGRRAVAGQIQGLDVVVENVVRRTARKKTTRLEITVNGGEMPRDISFTSENVLWSVAKVFTGEDVHLLDQSFDEKVLVQGQEVTLFAMLDAPTRRRIEHLVGPLGSQLRDNAITCHNAHVTGDVERTVDAVHTMVNITKALSLHGPIVPVRLLTNTERDPLPAVRQRNFELLSAHFADSSQAVLALELALKDADPYVRLAAAKQAGDASFGALRALVSDRAVIDGVRCDALNHLATHCPAETVHPILDPLLSAPNQDLRVQAIAIAGGTRHHDAVPRLISLLPRAEPKTKTTIITALTRLRARPAAVALVALLGDTHPGEVRVAAAEALAVLGDIESVPALRAQTEGFVGDNQVKRAALRAISKIQARVGGDAQGRLSLAKSEAGGLSLAAEPGLALANEDGHSAP